MPARRQHTHFVGIEVARTEYVRLGAERVLRAICN